MSTTRPRVAARYEELPITYTTPRVLVEVTFDLHDHAAALDALERAVADVRAQIEDTHRESV